MTIRVILKSGAEIAVKCENVETKRNGFGELVEYSFEGITENKPVYLRISEVAAIVRVMTDE